MIPFKLNPFLLVFQMFYQIQFTYPYWTFQNEREKRVYLHLNLYFSVSPVFFSSVQFLLPVFL
jgi:hypothetical protein